MMDVRPFHIDHMRRMKLQKAQAYHSSQLDESFLADIEKLGAFTGLIDDEPIVIAGLMEFWPGRAMAWSYLSELAAKHMLSITRAVLAHLELHAPRRTEIYVDLGFEAGYRWARMLGFNFEGNLTAFTPDGRDQALFSRIR